MFKLVEGAATPRLISAKKPGAVLQGFPYLDGYEYGALDCWNEVSFSVLVLNASMKHSYS